jgi:hypothetical protein
MEIILGSDFDSKKAFSFLINSFGPHLPKITISGLTTAKLRQTMKNFSKYVNDTSNVSATYTPAFSKDASPTLTEWWDVVTNHISIHGEGTVVMGITGFYNHWTCIRRLMPNVIIFADSGYITSIKRANVTVKTASKNRPHVLIPYETFLVIPEKRSCVAS